jgi:hypothetical protein
MEIRVIALNFYYMQASCLGCLSQGMTDIRITTLDDLERLWRDPVDCVLVLELY